MRIYLGNNIQVGGIEMGVENIISYVNTKTDMVRCAYAYLYSLEGYHDFHRLL